MSIKARVFWLAGSLLFIMILLCCSMIFLLQQSNNAFATTYHDRVIPLKQLKVVADMFAVNVVDTIHKTNAGRLSSADGIKSISTAEAEFSKQWQAYSATRLTREEAILVDKTNAQLKQALDIARQARTLMQDGKLPELKQLADQQLYPAIDPLSTLLSQLTDLQLNEAEKNYQHSEENLRTSMLFALGALGAGLLIGSAMAWRLSARLSSSVRELGDTCAAIVSGHNLALRIPERGRDELSTIARQLNHLLDNMGGIIREVRDSSDNINQMARNIGQASETISHSSRRQSEATSSIASTVEQFAVSITHIADSADVARQRQQRGARRSACGQRTAGHRRDPAYGAAGIGLRR